MFFGQQSVVSSLTARWGSLIPAHVSVPPQCVMFSSFCDPRRIFRYSNNPAVENTSENAAVAEAILGDL